MTLEKKKYIIENLKWPLDYLNFSSNYIILIGPISLVYIGASECIKGNYILFPLLLGIISFFFIAYRINQERKLVELIIEGNISTSEIIECLEKEK